MNEECCNHNCNQGRDCPLRKKELTDEEIDAIENAVYCKTIQKGKTPHEYIIKFARAILKKASEK